MKRVAVSVGLVLVLALGFTQHSYGATLRGESVEYIKELQKYARDLIDLCQYAETKFEKKYCFREADSLTNDVWFGSIMKQFKDKVFEIKNKYKDEFKKTK
jgi:flavodoxin